MKTWMAKLNGIMGLVIGILLALDGLAFVVAEAIEGSSDVGIWTVFILYFVLKLVMLGFAIWGLIYYKDNSNVKNTAGILMVTASGVSLVPFLGWIGGIVMIIGAIKYLLEIKVLKNVKTEKE